MKRLLSVFLILFLSCYYTFGQVTTVKLSLEYNESTNLFDCFLFVGSGSTRPDMSLDRVLFNSQISVVSHVGTAVSIAELNMPLLDNMDGNGTEPLKWVIANTFESPVERPELKYHSIIPNLSPVGHFNNLSPGSKVRLFSLSANPIDTCEYKLRLFDKQVDKYTFNGFDFNNGFTVGGPTQLYLGNIDDNFMGGEGPVIDIDSSSYCEGEVVQFDPSVNGMWVCSDTVVAAFSGSELITRDSGVFYIWLVGDTSECNSNISQLQVVFDTPQIFNNDIDSLIVGDLLLLSSDLDCEWMSGDENVASVSAQGLVKAISPGTVVISARDTLTGCESQITLTVEDVSSVLDFNSIYKIYPNPVRNVLYIEGISSGDELQVTDPYGRVVNVQVSGNAIDVAHIPNGIYIITIYSDGKWASSKFTKLSN